MKNGRSKYQQAVFDLQVTLRRFIAEPQRKTMLSLLNSEEGEFFIEKVLELAKTIDQMPVTYKADEGDPIIHLHYFIRNVHAWITEKDMYGAGTEQAFGVQSLDGTVEGGELGYISIDELVGVGAEIDLYWTPKRLSELRGETLKD